MKLYIFETCPFCNRVRIFAGLKGLSFDTLPMSPGKMPARLRGRVTGPPVPIRERSDMVLQDSVDIILQLDSPPVVLGLGGSATERIERKKTQCLYSPMSELTD